MNSITKAAVEHELSTPSFQTQPGHARLRALVKIGAGAMVAAVIGLSAVYYLTRAIPVALTHPQRGTIVDAVYATGTIEPTVMIPIAPRATARLVQLLVDEGQAVTRGQPLAVLEDDDLRQAVAEADAERKYAAQEYARLLQLPRNEVVSQTVLDRARANLDKTTAALARATAQARFLTLASPAEGVVIRRDGEVGQLLTPSSTVFWLTGDRALRITAEIDEEEIGRVAVGQRVVIHADAFPGRTFEGRVQAITPKGDPVARSYRARIALTGETPLMIGMTVETNIIVKTQDAALLVPASAMHDGSVWVAIDGRATARKITVGLKTATHVEVVSGLSAGDTFIDRPPAALKAGDRVKAVQ